MDQARHEKVVPFICGIAADVHRNLYVRGKCRDVTLPMTVLRRLDAVRDPTKQAERDLNVTLDKEGSAHQNQARRGAVGQPFYHDPKFTLRSDRARGTGGMVTVAETCRTTPIHV